MQQIFVRDILELNNDITVTGDDAHHLIDVVRIKSGEQIRVSNHEGDSFLADVVSVDKSGQELVLRLLEELSSSELDKEIVLFQGVAKSDRMEYIIQKATELGASRVVPVEMQYCVAKVDEKKKDAKVKRYNAIALSAAQQSKRSVVPKIKGFLSFDEALEFARTLDMVIVCYEASMNTDSLKNLMHKIDNSQSVGVFIGPEGGFSDDEISALTDFDIISLGRRILRTDTAAITSLSAIMLYLEATN